MLLSFSNRKTFLLSECYVNILNDAPVNDKSICSAVTRTKESKRKCNYLPKCAMIIEIEEREAGYTI